MTSRFLGPAALAAPLLLLVACGQTAAPPLLGTLEWDRVGVAAELSEPITRIAVAEGERVTTGALILQLDARRTQAQLEGARAQREQAAAAYAKLSHGARPETIEALRAELHAAQAEAGDARRTQQRSAQLFKDGVINRAEFDRAETSARSAEAQARAAQARLNELLHGSRAEDLEQAAAVLAAAEADSRLLELRLERLSVKAPRDGRIDALPFKLGDQPPLGATLVSLLAGDSPYARVYVPASQRAQLAVGARCSVMVEGVADTYTGRLRSLRSDPAFTPYYALSGDDASRLAYRAEIVLDAQARDLPAGLPAQARCESADAP